jgi:acarbose 7IV-phosphotransferase
MSRFFVAGLVNSETTLAVDGFPLAYYPVAYPYFGVNTTVSGVGFNIAKALTKLGNTVEFASLIGRDPNGTLARRTLRAEGISDRLVLDGMDATAQSVILYEPGGRRQIHVDLKDIQARVFPVSDAHAAIQASDLAVICNINFARPLLQVAQEAGRMIATDVHALKDLADDYNQEFIEHANILFLSDEALVDSPEDNARLIMEKYDTEIVVIGLGARGSLLAVRQDKYIGRHNPVFTRPVVNTIGAGDALFSAFLDRYQRTKDPYQAIRAANIFASYKIGENGAAEGFLTGVELDGWLAQTTLEE